MIRLWFAPLTLCGCLGCSPPLTADECNQLLDRYTEKVAEQQSAETSSESVFRMQRDARARAAMSPEFSRCAAKVSRRQWRCAMSAPSVDDIERCLL